MRGFSRPSGWRRSVANCGICATNSAKIELELRRPTHSQLESSRSRTVTCIRPGAQRPESIRLENRDSAPLAISVGEGGVWVITWGTNGGIGRGSPQALLEFDPDTLQRVNRIPFYGRGLWTLAAGGGSIWVAASSNSSPRNSSVIRLDPRSGRIIQTIPIGSPNHAIPCGIAATNDAVWVTVGDANCDINGQ